MHALAMLPGPYLPWSAGTMRPAGLVTVCNDIVLNDRRRIVELGSGISTVLLARLLTQRALPGGVLMAVVEHDDFWAQWVGEQLDREGTGTDLTVVRSALTPHPRAERGLRWYGEAALADGLREALQGDPIDLLVVDGPPAHAVGHGLARYPALPALGDRLAPGATVVLDDAERQVSRRFCAGGSGRRGSASTVAPSVEVWRWPGCPPRARRRQWLTSPRRGRGSTSFG